MKPYKAVLFDFGNVIINIDPALTFKAFAELTFKSEERIREQISESDLFRRYEIGLFDDEEFREIVRQTLGYPLSDEEVDRAWNSLLLDVPPHRVGLVLDLKAKTPVYLLSNTNSIHIQFCNDYFRRNFGIPSVSALFDHTFYSYEMGLWKPDEAIYQEVLSETGLQAEEVLFIDDNEKNIAAAKAMGFQAILHDPKNDIKDYFD